MKKSRTGPRMNSKTEPLLESMSHSSGTITHRSPGLCQSAVCGMRLAVSRMIGTSCGNVGGMVIATLNRSISTSPLLIGMLPTNVARSPETTKRRSGYAPVTSATVRSKVAGSRLNHGVVISPSPGLRGASDACCKPGK